MDAVLAYWAANNFAQETQLISILESQKIVQIIFFNRLIGFYLLLQGILQKILSTRLHVFVEEKTFREEK